MSSTTLGLMIVGVVLVVASLGIREWNKRAQPDNPLWMVRAEMGMGVGAFFIVLGLVLAVFHLR